MFSLVNKRVLLAGIIFILTPFAVFSEVGFKITDYQPDLFKDIEMIVGGDLRLSGHNQEIIPSFYSSYNKRETSDINLSSTFNGYFRYRDESIPGFTKVTAQLRPLINYRDNSYHEVDIDGGYYNSLRENSTNQDTYYALYGAISVNRGRYVSEKSFIEGTLFANIEYRDYLDKNRNTDRIIQVNYGDTQETRTYVIEEDNDNLFRRYRVNAMITPGVGRVFEGKYSATALYILEEFEKGGYLIRQPDKNQFVKLCELVYKNRNLHAIDSRIRHIEIYNELMAYLQTEGLIDTESIPAAFILQDIWLYYPREDRRFGSKISGGVGLKYDLYNSEDTRNVYSRQETVIQDDISGDTTYFSEYDRYQYREYKEESYKFYLTIGYEYYQPLNRKWQLDLSLESMYYVDSKDKRTEFENIDGVIRSGVAENKFDYEVEFDGSGEVTCFLSSRSRFSSQLDITIYWYELSDDIDVDDPNNGSWQFRVGFSYTYRVSMPTELYINGTYQYADYGVYFPISGSGNYSDNVSYQLRVGLNHHIL